MNIIWPGYQKFVSDTDRNFVAKYSQQVLHFDHEVTYYLQSINDSGQSTQN